MTVPPAPLPLPCKLLLGIIVPVAPGTNNSGPSSPTIYGLPALTGPPFALNKSNIGPVINLVTIALANACLSISLKVSKFALPVTIASTSASSNPLAALTNPSSTALVKSPNPDASIFVPNVATLDSIATANLSSIFCKN